MSLKNASAKVKFSFFVQGFNDQNAKNCADLWLLKASDASKGCISKLGRSSTNIIIMLRCVQVVTLSYDVLRQLTTLCLYH